MMELDMAIRSTPRRSHVNKRRSARSFRRHVGRTSVANVRQSPMRGGWRF